MILLEPLERVVLPGASLCVGKCYIITLATRMLVAMITTMRPGRQLSFAKPLTLSTVFFGPSLHRHRRQQLTRAPRRSDTHGRPRGPENDQALRSQW